MSQDVSTNQGVREPLTPPPNQPWSAEAEADKLMDDLFSDIDRILDGGTKLPTEPAKPEYVSLKSIVIPQITPPTVVPSQELQQPSLALTEDKPVEQAETEVAQSASPAAKRSGWSVEKLLLAGGIVSLLVTLILLLTNSSKLTWPWSPNSTSPSSLKGQSGEADSQFASYMLRSLDVIDHKTKAKQKTATVPNGSGTANLPSIPAPSNRTLASNQSPSVLEKVYIPVPMPQVPVAPSTSSTAVKPSVSTAKPPAPAASSGAKLPAPPPLEAIRLPTLTLPKAVAPAPAPPPSAASNSPTPQVQAAVARHTLVGLLELGDHSAALFDINGITQRINVGGSIGNSGWTLVSVANQEAVIRRNGEVRSVYIGQKF